VLSPTSTLAQLAVFAGVGAGTWLLYALVYAALFGPLGALAGNLVAQVVGTTVNIGANRALTFGVRDRGRLARDYLEAALIFAVAIAANTTALVALFQWRPDAGVVLSVGVIAATNVTGALVRFVLFKLWVFHPSRR
jgi:putative flippase GtrA